jgi:hypothetical protein
MQDNLFDSFSDLQLLFYEFGLILFLEFVQPMILQVKSAFLEKKQ